MANQTHFSKRHMLAAMQIMDWVSVQTLVHGRGGELLEKAGMTSEEDARRGLKLMELKIGMGPIAFIDHLAELAHYHVQGQLMGIRLAAIKDYDRSHDVIWTSYFMNFCCVLTDEGYRLAEDWGHVATVTWVKVFGVEISRGIRPDLPSREERERRRAEFLEQTGQLPSADDT